MIDNTGEEAAIGYATRQEFKHLRTTISLKTTTKDKLNNNRAPGQCYDGFIYQLVDFWEKNNGK